MASAIGEALIEVAEAFGQAAVDFMPDICTIKRMEASNGTAAPQTKHSNVPCVIEPMGSGGGGQAIRAKAAYAITMPGNLSGVVNSVKVEDLIVSEARGLQPARTFKVQSVEQDKGIKVIVRATIEA